MPRFILLENGDDHSAQPIGRFEDLTKWGVGRAWPAGRAESVSGLRLLIPSLLASGHRHLLLDLTGSPANRTPLPPPRSLFPPAAISHLPHPHVIPLP